MFFDDEMTRLVTFVNVVYEANGTMFDGRFDCLAFGGRALTEIDIVDAQFAQHHFEETTTDEKDRRKTPIAEKLSARDSVRDNVGYKFPIG